MILQNFTRSLVPSFKIQVVLVAITFEVGLAFTASRTLLFRRTSKSLRMDAQSMLQHQNRRSQNPSMAPSLPPITLPAIAETAPLSSSISSTASSITTNSSTHPSGFQPASFGGSSSTNQYHPLSPARSIPSMRENSRSNRSLMPSSLPSRGFVIGPPSRSHWKPDSSSQTCDSCRSKFGLLTRRHHCRACGGLFCGACSPHVARLDHTAQPHPAGMLCRICSNCHAAFERKALEELEHSMNVATMHQEKLKRNDPSNASAISADGRSGPSATLQNGEASKAVNIRKPPKNEGAEGDLPPSLSVPSDWTWSTF
ncbi:hypothetical protein BC829DRAFT_185940 [Chytridium lagenaria]|nr:hypothetical protein BC829DRAFT_185940 [Chytridium lagenaria]